jgi:polysaccharide biosynthesis transport protein
MGANRDLTLRDYLTVLRRQAWIVILAVLVVVGVAVTAAVFETPVYEARAEVVIEPIRRTQDVSLEQLLAPTTTVMETERVIITSLPVTERAIDELGFGDPDGLAGQVRVEVVSDTRIVEIVAEDTDPERAAAIANAYAFGYLEFRREQAVDEVRSASADLQERADALRAEIAAVEAQADGAPDDEASALEVQRESLLAQLSQVLAQLSEIDGSANTITGGGAVIAPARVPSEPVSPRPVRTAAVATVLGLLLGVGLAILRDYFDDVIRDEADFKRATAGLPVFGRIPRWRPGSGTERLVTVVEPASVAAESYRELTAGVRFLRVTRRHPVAGSAAGAGHHPEVRDEAGLAVMIVSAGAGDGKTTTAANLAVSTARFGLRTVLVDADLRRSMVHRRFGIGRTTGLADALLGDGPLADHLIEGWVDNLAVLPGGTALPNPTELLASPAMGAVHEALVRQADLVIYDAPAALAVSDALELGQFVDVALLVGRLGFTSRRQLGAALERLEQIGCNVAGTVLNDVEVRGDAYYSRYHTAVTHTDDDERPGLRSLRVKPRQQPRAEPTPPVRARELSHRSDDQSDVAERR